MLMAYQASELWPKVLKGTILNQDYVGLPWSGIGSVEDRLECLHAVRKMSAESLKEQVDSDTARSYSLPIHWRAGKMANAVKFDKYE